MTVCFERFHVMGPLILLPCCLQLSLNHFYMSWYYTHIVSFCNYALVALGYPGVNGEPREKETVCHTDPEAVWVWHVPPWNQPGQISPSTRVRAAHTLRQLTVISIGQETLTIRWSGMIETRQQCLKIVLFWRLNWEEMDLVNWDMLWSSFFCFVTK